MLTVSFTSFAFERRCVHFACVIAYACWDLFFSSYSLLASYYSSRQARAVFVLFLVLTRPLLCHGFPIELVTLNMILMITPPCSTGFTIDCVGKTYRLPGTKSCPAENPPRPRARLNNVTEHNTKAKRGGRSSTLMFKI